MVCISSGKKQMVRPVLAGREHPNRSAIQRPQVFGVLNPVRPLADGRTLTWITTSPLRIQYLFRAFERPVRFSVGRGLRFAAKNGGAAVLRMLPRLL
jgi:hypothetical protein